MREHYRGTTAHMPDEQYKDDRMNMSKEESKSHLFLLRVWTEDETDLPGEWSARLQHVFSGESHTFRACPQLVDVLLRLSGGEGQTPQDEAHSS